MSFIPPIPITVETHKCCAIGCCRQIALNRLMCADHAAMVPKWLAREIKREFDQGDMDRCVRLLLQAIRLVERVDRLEKSLERGPKITIRIGRRGRA